MIKEISLYGKEETVLGEAIELYYFKNIENDNIRTFINKFQENEIICLIGEKLVYCFNFNYMDTDGCLFLLKSLNSTEINYIGGIGKKLAIQIYYLLKMSRRIIEKEDLLYKKKDKLEDIVDFEKIITSAINLNVDEYITESIYENANELMNSNFKINEIDSVKNYLENTIKKFMIAIVQKNEELKKELTNEIYPMINNDLHKEFEERYFN